MDISEIIVIGTITVVVVIVGGMIFFIRWYNKIRREKKKTVDSIVTNIFKPSKNGK